MRRFTRFGWAALMVFLVPVYAQAVTLNDGDIIVTKIVPPSVFRVDPASGDQELIADFSGSYQSPRGLLVDEDGALVLGVKRKAPPHGVVIRLDPETGNITEIARLALPLRGPTGMVFDTNGDILEVDQGLGGSGMSPVTKIDIDTGMPSVLYSDPAFNQLIDLKIDDRGDLIVVDADGGPGSQGALHRIDVTTGSVTTISSEGFFQEVTDLDIDNNGDLIVTDLATGVIKVDPLTGAQTLLAEDPGLLGIAIDSTGDLIAADIIEDAVFRYDPTTGARTTVSSAGLLSGLVATVAIFSEPDGS